MMKTLAIGAFVLGLVGCAGTAASAAGLMDPTGGSSPADAAQLQGKPLGSADNPVRADMPDGQKTYLRRLRCSDGRAPTFRRLGNIGAGPYGSIVDGFEVRCANASPAISEIHIDMYHPGYVEAAAPTGFTIVP